MRYVPFMWSATTDLDRPELKTRQHSPTATPSTKTFIWNVETATKYPTAMVRKSPDTICFGMIPVAYLPLFGDYYHGNNRNTVAVCAIYSYCMILTLAVVLGFASYEVYLLCFLQMLALPATVNGSGRIAMLVALLETIGQFLLVGYDYVELNGLLFWELPELADYAQVALYTFLSIQSAALLAIPLWELFSHTCGPGVGMFDSPVNGEVNSAEVFQYAVRVVRWRPPFRLSEWKAINKHSYDPSRLAYFSTARRWLNEIVMIPGLAILKIDWTVPRISHNFHLPNPLPLIYYIAVSCAVSTCVFLGIIMVPRLQTTFDEYYGREDPIFVSLGATAFVIVGGHIIQYLVVRYRCRQVQQGLQQSPISATPYLAVNFIGSSIMGHLIAFTVLFFVSLMISTIAIIMSSDMMWELVKWVFNRVIATFLSAIVAQILLRVFMSRVVADQKDIKKPYLFSAAYLYIAMASTVSMLMVLLRTLIIYVIILPISAMFPLFPLFSMLPRLDPAYTGLWAALSMHNTARNPLKITMVGYMLARAEIRSITQKAVLQFGLDRCLRMSGIEREVPKNRPQQQQHEPYAPPTAMSMAPPQLPASSDAVVVAASTETSVLSRSRSATSVTSNPSPPFVPSLTLTGAAPIDEPVTPPVTVSRNVREGSAEEEEEEATPTPTPTPAPTPEATAPTPTQTPGAASASAPTPSVSTAAAAPVKPGPKRKAAAPLPPAAPPLPVEETQGDDNDAEVAPGPTPAAVDQQQQQPDDDRDMNNAASAENSSTPSRSSSSRPTCEAASAAPQSGDVAPHAQNQPDAQPVAQPQCQPAQANNHLVPPHSGNDGTSDDDDDYTPRTVTPASHHHPRDHDYGEMPLPTPSNSECHYGSIPQPAPGYENHFEDLPAVVDVDDVERSEYMLRLSDFGSSQRFLHLTHSIRLWVLFRAGFLGMRDDDKMTPTPTLMYYPPSQNEVAEFQTIPWRMNDDFAREDVGTRESTAKRLSRALSTNYKDSKREQGERDEIRRRRADNSYRDSYYPLGMGCEEELHADDTSDVDEIPSTSAPLSVPFLRDSQIHDGPASSIRLTPTDPGPTSLTASLPRRTFASLPGPAVSKRDIERSLTGLVRAIFSNARLLVPLRAILQTSEAKDMLSELQHRKTPTRPMPVPPGMSAIAYAALVARQQVSPYRRRLRVANRWLLALMLLRYPSIRPLRKHALRKTQYTPAVPMLRGVLESHCGQSGGCCCCCYCTSCE